MNVLPSAVHANQLDFAAEKHRQFAADGKTQARAAVFAGGSGVRLLESLEDQSLLLRSDADAGVGYGEGHHLLSHTQHRVIEAPALCRETDANFHLAVRSELDGIG